MRPDDAEKYREALRVRAGELRRSLRRRREIAVETTADAMDQTVMSAERELMVQSLDSNFRLLRLVEAALARINDGTYGECVRCRQAIRSVRLDAIPWAMYCVKCQEEVDRLHTAVRAFEARVA